MGLGGARRLVNELQIDSRPGQGTRITAIRWA
jgi:serine/threonine-protein kinase RsbT